MYLPRPRSTNLQAREEGAQAGDADLIYRLSNLTFHKLNESWWPSGKDVRLVTVLILMMTTIHGFLSEA